ncbi:hypothetical protein V8D89_014761 [Ganoderma adspersum]
MPIGACNLLLTCTIVVHTTYTILNRPNSMKAVKMLDVVLIFMWPETTAQPSFGLCWSNFSAKSLAVMQSRCICLKLGRYRTLRALAQMVGRSVGFHQSYGVVL